MFTPCPPGIFCFATAGECVIINLSFQILLRGISTQEDTGMKRALPGGHTGRRQHDDMLFQSGVMDYETFLAANQRRVNRILNKFLWFTILIAVSMVKPPMRPAKYWNALSKSTRRPA